MTEHTATPAKVSHDDGGDRGEKIPAVTKRDTATATLDDVKLQEPSAETYAAIMATHKPNLWGPGYLRLYLVATSVFLCSTMSGKLIRSLPAAPVLSAEQL